MTMMKKIIIKNLEQRKRRRKIPRKQNHPNLAKLKTKHQARSEALKEMMMMQIVVSIVGMMKKTNMLLKERLFLMLSNKKRRMTMRKMNLSQFINRNQ